MLFTITFKIYWTLGAIQCSMEYKKFLESISMHFKCSFMYMQIYTTNLWSQQYFFSCMECRLGSSTVFPRFLHPGTINFSASQDVSTIRGWEQNKGGVNITRQRMQSIVSRFKVLSLFTMYTVVPLVKLYWWTLNLELWTQGPPCCQQWAQLSQSRSLLRRQLLPPSGFAVH